MPTGAFRRSLGRLGREYCCHVPLAWAHRRRRATAAATLSLVAAALLAVPVTPASAACPSSSSAYRTMVLGTAGLAAYWRLDESSGTDACDSKGTSAGQYGGGSQLAQGGALSGDTNTAVALDGLTGRVAVPSTLPLNPSSAVSMEAWVRPSVLSASQTVVRKDQQYLLRLEGGKIYARVWLVGGTYAQVSTTAVVQAGAWQHVVATFDGSSLRVYRNGTQLAVVGAAEAGPGEGVDVGGAGGGPGGDGLEAGGHGAAAVAGQPGHVDPGRDLPPVGHQRPVGGPPEGHGEGLHLFHVDDEAELLGLV